MARWCCPTCSRPTWAATRRSLVVRRDLESVADAANGGDAGGVLGVIFDECAQTLDVHVEGLRVAHVVTAPDSVNQHLAGEHPAGIFQQQSQQGELLLAQLDFRVAHEATPGVNVHADSSALNLLLLAARLVVNLAAAKHCVT